MKYELGLLESLVRYDLWSKNYVAPEEWVRVSAVSFREEINRIKTELRNQVFSATDERSIEIYIQNHQQVLIELTNLVLEKLGTDADVVYASTPLSMTTEDFRITMYRIMYKGLEELLAFIEKYFTKYFSLDTCIPDSYKWIAMRDFKESVPPVIVELNAKNCDRTLLVLACYPLIKFMEHSGTMDITYRRVIYLKELVKQLRDLIRAKHTGRKLNQNLRMLLFYLDYNSPRVFNYATDLIALYAKRFDSREEHVNRLSYAKKFIEQAQLKPGFSYDPRYASIKEQLLGWISAELYYLSREERSALAEPEATPYGDIRIKTGFSVPQLAYFMKILVDIDVVQTKNIQELTRLITRCVSTKRAEAISEESFRTKFYTTESGARNAVKDVIIEMMNYVKRN